MNINDVILNNSQLLEAYNEILANMEKNSSLLYKNIEEFIMLNSNKCLGDIYNSNLPMLMFDKSMIGKIVYLILDLNIKQKKLDQNISLKEQQELLYAQEEQKKEELSKKELAIYSRYYECINEMEMLKKNKDYYEHFDLNSELVLRNFKFYDEEMKRVFEAFFKFVVNKYGKINLAEENIFEKLINDFANEKERLIFGLKTAIEPDIFFGDEIQLMLPVLKERVEHMITVVAGEFASLKKEILNNPRLSHNIDIDGKLAELEKKQSEIQLQQSYNDYFVACNKLSTALHREVNFRAIDELACGKIPEEELYNDLVYYCNANNIDIQKLIDYYSSINLDVKKSVNQNTDDIYNRKAKR